MITNDSKVQQSQVYSLAEQADAVAFGYSAISSSPKTVSVVSKLQFTHASKSSHSWLSKQPQLVKSSKLVVASLSCAELGTAQPQLVFILFSFISCLPSLKFMMYHYPPPPPYSTIIMVKSSLPTYVIFSVHVCMHKTA